MNDEWICRSEDGMHSFEKNLNFQQVFCWVCTTRLQPLSRHLTFFTNLSILEGRRHGAAVLAESGLLQDLHQHAVFPHGHPMCLYSDPAYPLRLLSERRTSLTFCFQKCCFNTPDARRVQCQNEFCEGIYWMAIWEHSELLQIHRLQKKFEDRLEQHW